MPEELLFVRSLQKYHQIARHKGDIYKNFLPHLKIEGHVSYNDYIQETAQTRSGPRQRQMCFMNLQQNKAKLNSFVYHHCLAYAGLPTKVLCLDQAGVTGYAHTLLSSRYKWAHQIKTEIINGSARERLIQHYNYKKSNSKKTSNSNSK